MCTTEIVAAIAHVDIFPSEELRAYLAVADIQAFVNGDVVTNFDYTEPNTSDGPIELEVYAGCIVEDEGASRGLDPGEHRLELRAHVSGESEDPPPIFTHIELRCEGEQAEELTTSVPSSESSYSNPDHADGGQTSEGLGTSPESGSNSRRIERGGCSISKYGIRNDGYFAALLLIGLLINRRRRTKKPTRDRRADHCRNIGLH